MFDVHLVLMFMTMLFCYITLYISYAIYINTKYDRMIESNENMGIFINTNIIIYIYCK